MLWTICQNFT